MRVLVAGMPERATLDKLQAQIIAIDQKIEETDNAPLHPKDAATEIDRVLDRERESVVHALRQVLRENHRDVDLRDVSAGGLFRITQLGLIDVFLGRDAARQRWLSAITTEDASYAPGLPRADRDRALEKLRAERTRLEREEELEALRVEDASGAFVVRRGDANVDLLLELWR